MEVDKMTETTSFIKCEVKTESLEPMEQRDPIPLQQTIKAEEAKDSNGQENNGRKRTTTESDDSISKKPRMSNPEVSNINTSKEDDDAINMSDVEEYYLTISNLPKQWTYVQIKNYLDKECGHVDEMEMLSSKENSQACDIRLTFQSAEDCNKVYKMLENKVIEGNQLKISKTESSSTTFSTDTASNSMPLSNVTTSKTDIVPKWSGRSDEKVLDPYSGELYGLRPQFLKSLNLTPPLTSMVHVTNFRCDKIELREVMELAGNVLMCYVVTTINKYAKVMYSHPLEAVQAISMLNGQKYYGNPLKITMDKYSGDYAVLPKGLPCIGAGLGLQGKPIRDIANHYQRYIKNESSLLNPVLFCKADGTDDSENNIVKNEENSEEIQKKIDELSNTSNFKNIDELNNQTKSSKDGSNRSTPDVNNAKSNIGESGKSSTGSLSPNTEVPAKSPSNTPTPMLTNSVSTTSTIPLIRLGSHSNKQPFVRPLMQMSSHNPMPMTAPVHPNYRPVPNQRPGQFGPRPFMPVQNRPFGPVPGSFGSTPVNFGGPQPYVRPMINPGNCVTVNFSNLPPSTTFPLLCDKISQCGQVMSVQLTTPGCAVAKFAHPSHAERCFQMFNGLNVEGYVIAVKFS